VDRGGTEERGTMRWVRSMTPQDQGMQRTQGARTLGLVRILVDPEGQGQGVPVVLVSFPVTVTKSLRETT
jgi:hypothetical protein